MDSDVYKAIEAASIPLPRIPIPSSPGVGCPHRQNRRRPAAGRIYDTYYIVKEPGQRWTNLRDCHELYCAGHMFEAAVAHFQATGQRTFLNIANKYADYIDSVFGPGKRMGYPGHPEIELALIKLWHVTGQQRYFNLARFFVETGPKIFAREHQTPLDQYDGTYWLDDVPIYDHKKIKGHAVRAPIS